MFLLAILIPACGSSSPAFHMMYSAYKLNKQMSLPGGPVVKTSSFNARGVGLNPGGRSQPKKQNIEKMKQYYNKPN